MAKVKIDKYKLPTELTEPCEELLEYSFLIYGRKGIGKTTLAARFPRAIHFMYEPGGKALRIFKVPVKGDCFTDWVDVRGFLKALKKKRKFDTVIFDTGNKAYELHSSWFIENKLDGIHPGKIKDWGASWGAMKDSFEDVHVQIAGMGMGFVCIAHEKFKDFEGSDGRDYVRVEPRFSSGCNEFYEGVIDVIGHYTYEGKNRFLQIRGDEFTIAKCRIEGHFLTPTGIQLWQEMEALDPEKDSKRINEVSDIISQHYIHKIPMGNSPVQAYTNLVRAFNNEQVETFSEREDRKDDKPIKKKKKKKFKVKKK